MFPIFIVAISFLWTGSANSLVAPIVFSEIVSRSHIEDANYDPMSSPGKLYAASDIAEIREITADIDSFRNYTVRSTEIFDQSTEGGELYHYYKGDELVKMVLRLYGETGQMMSEFYISGGQLIFVYSKETRYNSHILDESFDDARFEDYENRYYFKDGEMVLWIDPEGHEVGIAEENYAEVESELLTDAERYVNVENI